MQLGHGLSIPIRAILATAGGGAPAFSPSSLFASGEEGCWYDPSDFTTLYTNTNGTDAITAVEQPVGLMLDKSQGLVLGSELFTIGTFDSSSGWTLGSGWSIGSGLLTSAGSNANFMATAPLFFSGYGGKTVKVVVTVSAYTSGAINVFTNGTGAVETVLPTGAGEKTLYIRFPADTNGTLYIRSNASTPFAGSIDTVSVKELPGNHAVAANGSTARPVLRNRYQLLTYSEQFDNAAWTKVGTTIDPNVIAAPNGTMTADKWRETAGGTGHVVRVSAPVTTGATYRFSVYAKAAENSYVGLYGLKNAVGKFFNLSNGTVGNNLGSAPASAGIESVGNGWYRCWIIDTETATVSRNFQIYSSKDGTNWDYSGTLDDGIYIWGAQLTTAADHDAINGEYQRIEAAPTVGAAPTYDDDVTKFPPYLYATTDDAMSTASIDFSSGDEMSVFAGVTKEQDAATAHIVELSGNSSTTPGAFNLLAPSFGGANSYRILSGGTATAVAGTGVFAAAPDTSVITGLSDISDDVVTLRRNGSLVETATTDQGTGNYGNYPLYLFSRNNSSSFYTGRLYSLIVRNALTSGDELDNVEAYVAQKTGVTL